ncbi:MAG: FluC/FEX family fluoride channel [Cyanobacteriota bacterium]
MTQAQLGREINSLMLVATGAIPGALLRWHWAGHWNGTLSANLLAALALGGLLPLQKRHPRLLLVLGVGFCGSLSTFSTWMLEMLEALQNGRDVQALLVLLANLLGGLAAVGLGSTLSQRRLWQRQRRC